MPPIDQITTFISDQPVGTIIICVFALVLLVLAFFVFRAAYRAGTRFFHRFVAPRPVEDILTIVAASIATGVSAQGMWRFSGDVLGFDGPLRFLLFAFIEVAVITSAVRARRNMRENYSAGIDGVAVWALTCLTAVLSSMDARSVAEAVFRLAAPLVAAWLWERGMAIERHRITGRSRINWRITPERALVRVGLAEVSDRTASEVDAHRRLTRVALAAKRARALREAGASNRKIRAALVKLDRAMDRAVEHSGLAVDTARQEALLSQIGALYNTAALIDLTPPIPWSHETQEPPARPAVSAAPVILLADDDDEELQLPGAPSPVVDTAQRAAQIRAAREYRDNQIERKFVPRATDIAHETGIAVATAREYRALWKLEPRAHALLEAAYNEHGIIDTGTFPAIETEHVLTVNGSSPSR
jgi:predicted RNA-binding Zn ribbon-like protein